MIITYEGQRYNSVAIRAAAAQTQFKLNKTAREEYTIDGAATSAHHENVFIAAQKADKQLVMLVGNKDKMDEGNFTLTVLTKFQLKKCKL